MAFERVARWSLCKDGGRPLRRVYHVYMNAANDTLPVRELVAAKIHSMLPAGMGRLMFGTVKITGSARSFDLIADDDHVSIQIWGGRVENETLPTGLTYKEIVAHIVRVATEENPAPIGQFFTGVV
jgi:hypothetical protein